MQGQQNQSSKKKTLKYEDYLCRSPELIRYVSRDDLIIINQHETIIRALKNNNMTVKEIHGLYYDDTAKKFKFTLKTIYKHMEKLERFNLVWVSGHRITAGSRQTEKLFSRTANVFWPDPKEDEMNIKKENLNKAAEEYNNIISQLLQVKKAETTSFRKFFKTLFDLKHKSKVELLENAKDNKKIITTFSQIDVNKIEVMNELISLLLVFLRHPSLFHDLQVFYSGELPVELEE